MKLDQNLKEKIYQAVANEPFARAMQMNLAFLDTGHSIVEMVYLPDLMNNIYHRAHGGALFALIDEAFETASQTHGTIAVALNINVTYVRSPEDGDSLRAEAVEIAATRKTATYDIKVTHRDKDLIAVCQAVAYNTGRPVDF